VEARPRCSRLMNVSAAVLTVCLSLQWISNVDAGIAVSPLQQEVIARPGGEASFVIQLKNVQRTLSPSPEEVRLEVVDFAVSPDGAIGFGPEAVHNRSAKDWIHLDADRIVLAPGEARQVKSTVTVPHGASGDHWAAVMMTFGPQETQAGVNVVLRTASGVFVRVARQGNVARPRIRSLTVALPSLGQSGHEAPLAAEQDHLCLRASADVLNEGQVFFQASGTVAFYLDGRRKVASVPLSAPRMRVLPGDSRRLEGVLSVPLEPGRYVARCVLEARDHPGRMCFAETEFALTEELAALWQSRSPEESARDIQVDPAEVRVTAQPGRFTAFAVVVENEAASTVNVKACLEHGSIPKGWLRLDPDEFALAPRSRRSLVCHFSLPRDARPALYEGGLLVGVEMGGLASTAKKESHQLPILLTVTE